MSYQFANEERRLFSTKESRRTYDAVKRACQELLVDGRIETMSTILHKATGFMGASDAWQVLAALDELEWVGLIKRLPAKTERKFGQDERYELRRTS